MGAWRAQPSADSLAPGPCGRHSRSSTPRTLQRVTALPERTPSSLTPNGPCSDNKLCAPLSYHLAFYS